MDLGKTPDKRLDDIVKIILGVDNPEKIILYGSRARGKNGKRSDFDIAVFGKVNLGRMIDAVEEAETLLKIDLVAFDEIDNNKLKENILKEGVILYER